MIVAMPSTATMRLKTWANLSRRVDAWSARISNAAPQRTIPVAVLIFISTPPGTMLVSARNPNTQPMTAVSPSSTVTVAANRAGAARLPSIGRMFRIVLDPSVTVVNRRHSRRLKIVAAVRNDAIVTCPRKTSAGNESLAPGRV